MTSAAQVPAVPERLATYGTLAPGRPNHHQLDGLAGHWVPGYVRGTLVPAGWGADQGYPALVVDEQGGRVPVEVFTSPDLAAHWPRLDEFEGPDYQRVLIDVVTADGTVPAHLYALRPTRPASPQLA